ncbi:MAG: pilus assembly protein N-terminal domain-containing protein [Rhodospirillales bacterium]
MLAGGPAGPASFSPLRAETTPLPDGLPGVTQEAQLRYPTQITVPLVPVPQAKPQAPPVAQPKAQIQTNTVEAGAAHAGTPADAPLTAQATPPARAPVPAQTQPSTTRPAPLQPRTAAPRLVTPPAAGEAQPAAASAVAAPAVIALEINRGGLIRLPRAAATVFVANPEIADVQVKSPSIVYITAKKGGETTLIAVDEGDKVLLESRVVVSHNLMRLRDSLKQLAPSRQIDVSSVGEQLVLDGTVGSPTESEDMRRLAAATTGDEKLVINRLKVAAAVQVNLRVRVAEMSKDISKQLGFNWTLMRNVLGTTSDLAATLAVVNPNAASIPNKLTITGRRGSWDINTVIDAMDEENLLKILAQPNLTAMSGQTASFLVGGEFPIVVPQGDNTFTIEFKKFGVSLAFAPTVLNDERINLHVRPEVSDLSENGAVTLQGFTIPALATRRAETTVEVASGQSFAIAGLLRNDVEHSITKWPGLADIPILGALFRSDQFKRKETELVIIVTPYIVEPVAASQLSTPADGFRPPHDLDRIFYGAQWRRDPAPGGLEQMVSRRPRLAGPAGSQLE